MNATDRRHHSLERLHTVKAMLETKTSLSPETVPLTETRRRTPLDVRLKDLIDLYAPPSRQLPTSSAPISDTASRRRCRLRVAEDDGLVDPILRCEVGEILGVLACGVAAVRRTG